MGNKTQSERDKYLIYKLWRTIPTVIQKKDSWKNNSLSALSPLSQILANRPTMFSLFICFIELIEHAELKNVLWQAAAKVLTETEFKIIKAVYLHNQTIPAIAAAYDTVPERIRQIKRQALRKLSYNGKIQRITEDYGYGYYRHVGLSEFNQTWTSSVEYEAMRHEEALNKLA